MPAAEGKERCQMQRMKRIPSSEGRMGGPFVNIERQCRVWKVKVSASCRGQGKMQSVVVIRFQ